MIRCHYINVFRPVHASAAECGMLRTNHFEVRSMSSFNIFARQCRLYRVTYCVAESRILIWNYLQESDTYMESCILSHVFFVPDMVVQFLLRLLAYFCTDFVAF